MTRLANPSKNTRVKILTGPVLLCTGPKPFPFYNTSNILLKCYQVNYLGEVRQQQDSIQIPNFQIFNFGSQTTKQLNFQKHSHEKNK